MCCSQANLARGCEASDFFFAMQDGRPMETCCAVMSLAAVLTAQDTDDPQAEARRVAWCYSVTYVF